VPAVLKAVLSSLAIICTVPCPAHALPRQHHPTRPQAALCPVLSHPESLPLSCNHIPRGTPCNASPALRVFLLFPSRPTLPRSLIALFPCGTSRRTVLGRVRSLFFFILQEEVIAEGLEPLDNAGRDLSIRHGRQVHSFCMQGNGFFLVGYRSLRGSLAGVGEGFVRGGVGRCRGRGHSMSVVSCAASVTAATMTLRFRLSVTRSLSG
jgi:hypothetical protein